MKPSSPAKGPWQPPSAEELAKLLPQYEITRMLGRGGMGAVYQGTQKSLDRPVAIKILSNDLETADVSFAERFKNEAKAMAKLSHPGIVGVFDFGETATGLLYIVMEFIEGTDVSRMIARQGRLHTEHAMAITAHVCDALAYAHERGIIHRDIKPANIMVGYDGVVKVADFGLAKMTQSQNSGLTQSGMAMGTLHYMAPEALMLGSAVDHRADIYAVGVMLYQMLTGKIPHGMFELPSLQVPGLDPRYDSIISRAMREDREVRYQAAVELRHDLDAILTQPVVKVEAAAEKAPAALETLARPQRPAGQPYRPPQPEVIVRTEKKGSPLLWVGFIAMACIAGWLVFKDSSKINASPSPEAPPATTTVATSPAVENTPPLTGEFAGVTKDAPFVNSLGMKFVPVPGTDVLMCIHETRRQDYAAYAAANPEASSHWLNVMTPIGPLVQTDAHPVVNVNWNDAVTFCEWLSKKAGWTYRLPTDREWSFAVGLGEMEPKDSSPAKLHKLNAGAYPWGRQWPPPDRVGNYDDLSNAERRGQQAGIPGYSDGFGGSAPVMSFPPNKLGIHDLGGNAWEWCGDLMEASSALRVARGSSWTSKGGSRELESSNRDGKAPSFRFMDHGFRCVLEVANQPALTTKAPVVPPATLQPSQATTATVQTSPSTVGDPPNTTKRVTDLLALVDLKRDVLVGKWKTAADGIELEAGSYPQSRLDLPFAPPEEYDFEIEFTPTIERVGNVLQCFTAADRAVRWIMQGQPLWTTPVYAFQPLDGKGIEASEAKILLLRHLKKGQRYKSVVKVRKGSLQALLDGEVLVSWSGDMRRFPERWPPPWQSAKPFGIGAWDGGVIFHKAIVKEFVPAPTPASSPGQASATLAPTSGDPPKTTKRTTDLMPLADVTKDALAGTLTRDSGGALRIEPLNANQAARFQFPHPTEAAEFDYLIEFSVLADAKPDQDGFCMKFPAKGNSIKWAMQLFPTSSSQWYGFAGLDGKEASRSPPEVSRKGGMLARGVRHQAVVKVRKGSLTGVLNGKELVHWEGDIGRFKETAYDRAVPLRDPRFLGVIAGIGGVITHKATITEFLPISAASNLPVGPTTWTDTKGRSITATFKALASGNVLLDIAGKVTPVPLNTLSAESQKLARAYHDQSSAAAANDPATATKDRPFVNSLGMKFVPVPGTKVLFCIHEARYKDWLAYTSANGLGEPMKKDMAPVGAWITERADDHPVKNVTHDGAMKFCQWLSKKEGKSYRLPSDQEWSHAVGIGQQEDWSPGATPQSRSEDLKDIFPWGTAWPPPKEAGNLADTTKIAMFPQETGTIEGYTDGFPTTAPVMSFPPNPVGIYDLAGNVTEWVLDWWNPDQKERIGRGGAFGVSRRDRLHSAQRHRLPGSVFYNNANWGFRVVLELPDATPASSAAPQTAAGTWKPLRAGEYADSRDISIRGRFKSGQFTALTVRGSEAGEKPESKYWAALQTNGLEVVLFREWIKPPPGTSRFANSTLARTSLKQAIPKDKEYTLTFTAVGDQLEVLVDDVPVIKVVDKMLPGRFAGSLHLSNQTSGTVEWKPAPPP